MEKRIIVVGAGISGRTAIVQELIHRGLDDIAIFAFNDVKEILHRNLCEINDRPFINTRVPDFNESNEKPFICRGRHLYRRVITKNDTGTRVDWICQCGRKTTD